jgi:hypothetical protein
MHSPRWLSQHAPRISSPMFHVSPLRLSAVLRRWIIGCVVIALVVCGWASTLAQIQGARHFHHSPSVIVSAVIPTSNVPEFSASAFFGKVFQAPSRSIFVHAQPGVQGYSHDEAQRHHHDAPDSSAVALDAVSSFDAARSELNTSAAKASSLLWQSPALAMQPLLAAEGASHSPWCETPLWALKTSELRSLRRPPKRAA